MAAAHASSSVAHAAEEASRPMPDLTSSSTTQFLRSSSPPTSVIAEEPKQPSPPPSLLRAASVQPADAESLPRTPQPWRLIVRHVQVSEVDPLRFADAAACSLKVNDHAMQGKKLVFDQGVDLEESDARRIHVDFELTLAAGFSTLGGIGSTKKQRAKKAEQSQQTYRGSLTYAELCSNAVQYRVPLQLVSGANAGESGPQQVELVVWCFTGFAAYRQEGDSLVRFGEAPPEVLTVSSASTLAGLKPKLLKLLRLANRLDSVLQPVSSLYPAAQAAYSLVSLSLVFANDKLAQHERAKNLVNDMMCITDLIGDNVEAHHEELRPTMRAACLVVEQASLWLFRYGESTFMHRTFSLRVRPKLEQHITALTKAAQQLHDRIDSVIAAKDYARYVEWLKQQFPVAPGSTIPAGQYVDLGDPGCLPGTRTRMLDQLDEWLCDAASPAFMLLEYCTGSGKSSVVEELVGRYEASGQVLATFRFKPECVAEQDRNLKSLSSALAHAFVDRVPSARRTLEVRHSQCRGVEAGEAFGRLISTLPHACFRSLDPNAPHLIIIDGVDESMDPKPTMTALAKWIEAQPRAYKVLITSRRFYMLLALFDNSNLFKHQLLRSDDVGTDLLVHHLCNAHVKVDAQVQNRLVEAAEELPLWVTRGFERIAPLVSKKARVDACLSLSRDGTVLFQDFERTLSLNFPPVTADNAGAGKLIQALHAILSFLQKGKESASKEMLVALYDDYWIADALVRLKPLLKGGMDDQDALSVLHSSLFNFVSSSAAPQRFQINTPLLVLLLRRCAELLRLTLKPLHNPYQGSLAVEYAVKHWPAHWLEAVELEDPKVTEECVELLYDFISGEGPDVDGMMLRDDPRVPLSEQRGGFASWAEAHYKLQQSPESNISSPSSAKARELSLACAIIAQKSPMLADKATYCMRILEEYATLAERIEDPNLEWKDDDGEPCSSDGSGCFWFSLLAAAPRSSLLFQHVGKQRPSPCTTPLAEGWKSSILSRIVLSTPEKNESALMRLLPPTALHLRSTHEKGARDVLLNLTDQRLMVLRLEPDSFLFIEARREAGKAWIVSLDQDEVVSQRLSEKQREKSKAVEPPASSEAQADAQSWKYDPLGDGEAEPKAAAAYAPKNGVKAVMATIVTSRPEQDLREAQVQSRKVRWSPARIANRYSQKLKHGALALQDVHEKEPWLPLRVEVPTAMLVAPRSTEATSSALRPWRLIVRHIEINGADPLRFESSASCGLNVNYHAMQGEKLVFDQGVDLDELDLQDNSVEFELTLSEGIGRLASLSNKKAQAAAQRQHTYLGSLSYAELGTNAVEYRVPMVSQEKDARYSPSELQLVVWCFSGFAPYEEVDGTLKTLGQPPPHYALDPLPSIADESLSLPWKRFRLSLLELPVALPKALDHYVTWHALSTVLARVQSAFCLTALSFVFAMNKLEQYDLATEVAGEMVSIMNLVWMRLYEYRGSAEMPIEAECQLVEEAALWLLRYGRSALEQRGFYQRSSSSPLLHLAALQDARSRLSSRIAAMIDAAPGGQITELGQRETQQPQSFYVAPGSEILPGNFRQLGDPGCLPGTREKTLLEVQEWLQHEEAPNFLLLESHLGSGKSSVAEQIVGSDELGQVSATFRFDAEAVAVEHRNLRSLTSALGEQLTRNVYSMRYTLANEVLPRLDESHTPQSLPLLSSYSPLDAFRALIRVLRYEGFKDSEPKRLIVIDGVDASTDAQETMQALAEWTQSTPQYFKVLITSANFSKLLTHAKDHSLFKHQLLDPADAGIKHIVDYLWYRCVDAAPQLRSHFVEAAENLPLWVTRAMGRIAALESPSERLKACEAIFTHDMVLYNDFERALNEVFPLPPYDAPAHLLEAADKQLETLRAVLTCMSVNAEFGSKARLRGFLADTPAALLDEVLDRLRPLMKGGRSEEEVMSPIHSSFFTYLTSPAAPPHLRLSSLAAHYARAPSPPSLRRPEESSHYASSDLQSSAITL